MITGRRAYFPGGNLFMDVHSLNKSTDVVLPVGESTPVESFIPLSAWEKMLTLLLNVFFRTATLVGRVETKH